MFIEYHPDHLQSLADLYSGYAAGSQGLVAFPKEHWEGIFTDPGVDPRRDLIIVSRSERGAGSNSRGAGSNSRGAGSNSRGAGIDPAAFGWIYTKPAPSHVYLRGPYLSPDDPDIHRLIDTVLKKAVERAAECGAGHIEGRALYPVWVEAYERAGFRNMGAYERWRMFPLKGTVMQFAPPDGGHVRGWESVSDIPILMKLFSSAFENHWDYIPPRLEDYREIFTDRKFDRRLVEIALDNGVPAGYIFGQSIPDYSSPTILGAYLVSIGLDPVYRGRGWGKVLLSRWLRACYDSGLRAVELDVDEGNDVAKSLYTQFGFRMIRTEGVWRRYLDSNGPKRNNSD